MSTPQSDPAVVECDATLQFLALQHGQDSNTVLGDLTGPKTFGLDPQETVSVSIPVRGTCKDEGCSFPVLLGSHYCYDHLIATHDGKETSMYRLSWFQRMWRRIRLALFLRRVIRQHDSIVKVNFTRVVLDAHYCHIPIPKTYLRERTFKECSFAGAKIVGMALDGSKFHDCDFSGARFAGMCSLMRTEFVDCKLFGTTFRDCDLHRSTFIDSDVTHLVIAGERASFEDSTIKRIRFTNCSFPPGTKFTGATLDRVVFHDCELTGVDFSGTHSNHVIIETDPNRCQGMTLSQDQVDRGQIILQEIVKPDGKSLDNSEMLRRINVVADSPAQETHAEGSPTRRSRAVSLQSHFAAKVIAKTAFSAVALGIMLSIPMRLLFLDSTFWQLVAAAGLSASVWAFAFPTTLGEIRRHWVSINKIDEALRQSSS